MSLLKRQLTQDQKKKVKADLHVTKSPLGKEKLIVKSSGEVDKQEFPDSVFGEIDGVKFEIQSPQVEIDDKVYKREVRGDSKRLEHEQDIENLKHKLNMI